MTMVDTMKAGPRDILEQLVSGRSALYARAYEEGMNFSKWLEKEDPSEQYKYRVGQELDAFQRLMHEAGVRPGMSYEDFTRTKQLRALVPEWWARQWRKVSQRPPYALQTPQQQAEVRALLTAEDFAPGNIGALYQDQPGIFAKRLVPPIPLEQVVARTIGIRGADYRALYITDDFGNDAYRYKRITEGATIPATTIVTGQHTARIHKFGRALRASYEQLRRESIDRIAWIIQRMALQSEVDKVAIALDTIVNGDGNTSTSATVLNLTALDPATTANNMTPTAFMVYRLRFTAAYRLTTIIAQEAMLVKLFMLQIGTLAGQLPMILFQNGPFGGFNLMADYYNGRGGGPQAGVAVGLTADAPANQVVGFDNTLSVEQVNEIGADVSEVESIIENQTRLMTMTENVGFVVVDQNAAKILQMNA